MITFILLGAGAIVVLALIGVAWGANNRKRAGQAEVPTGNAPVRPKEGRATPPVN